MFLTQNTEKNNRYLKHDEEIVTEHDFKIRKKTMKFYVYLCEMVDCVKKFNKIKQRYKQIKKERLKEEKRLNEIKIK